MIGREAIGTAVMEGVQAANARYEAWSRGGWLTDSGAEGPVAATPPSMATEIKKCIKLAEHATVNREARTR